MGFKHQAALLEKARKKRLASERLSKLSNNELSKGFSVSRNGFLESREWKELRAKVLEFYGCTCMKCGYVAPTRSHINVDHIKNRMWSPELALDFNNCQVLCPPCNKKKGNKNEIDYRPEPEGESYDPLDQAKEFLKYL